MKPNKKQSDNSEDILAMIRAKNAEETKALNEFDPSIATLEELIETLTHPRFDNEEQRGEIIEQLLFAITRIQTDSGLPDEAPEHSSQGSPFYSNEQLNEASDNIHIQEALYKGFCELEKKVAEQYNRKIQTLSEKHQITLDKTLALHNKRLAEMKAGPIEQTGADVYLKNLKGGNNEA